MNIIKKDDTRLIAIQNANTGDVFVWYDAAYIISEFDGNNRKATAFSLLTYKMIDFNFDDMVLIKPHACIKLDGDGLLRGCI